MVTLKVFVKNKDKPMSLETIFSLCGALAMLGWLGLVVAPTTDLTRRLYPSLVAPVMLGVVYAYLMISFQGEAPAEGGFGTLEEVKALFSVDALLLAGWIHYLVFDLFIGAWILRDSQSHQINHFLVIPCLFFTLMAGPLGLLLYLVLRAIKGQTIEGQAIS